MALTVSIVKSFTLWNCICCGFDFAIPSEYDSTLRNNHKSLSCPSCKSPQAYVAKTPANSRENLSDPKPSCAMRSQKTTN
jgi:hypothetical protein